MCAALSILFQGFSPSPARAQSGWELGYQLAHIPDDTLPLGFSVGIVGSLTPTWSAIGEIAAARESEELPGIETRFTILDIGGGVRWTPETIGLDQSETDFMIQPGAGIAYRVTDLWSAVAALKLTETLTQNEFDLGDEFRLFFGVRLDF